MRRKNGIIQRNRRIKKYYDAKTNYNAMEKSP